MLEEKVNFIEGCRPEHVECLCRALELQCNIDGMERLLGGLEDPLPSAGLERHPCRDNLLRAKSFLLFHQQRFDELYELLTTNDFSSEHHPFLQQLWNNAHYIETEVQRGKVLDAVSRYRVRKKNPFPSTIWDGEGTSYCFKKSTIAALRAAYKKTRIPTQEHKAELAALTELSVEQVTNWFKNQRQRAKQLLKLKARRERMDSDGSEGDVSRRESRGGPAECETESRPSQEGIETGLSAECIPAALVAAQRMQAAYCYTACAGSMLNPYHVTPDGSNGQLFGGPASALTPGNFFPALYAGVYSSSASGENRKGNNTGTTVHTAQQLSNGKYFEM